MFSIIVAYYQGVNSKTQINRLLDSLRLQTCESPFEVLFVHDGPCIYPIDYNTTGLDVRFINTETRENKWGHNCRNLGIKEAKYDWLLFTNGDNLYYKRALEMAEKNMDHHKMYVYLLQMMGMQEIREPIPGGTMVKIQRWYTEPRDNSVYCVMTAKPLMCGNMDLMQFVTHKSLFPDGWNDYREDSDGFIFPRLAKNNEYKHINYIIGKHY